MQYRTAVFGMELGTDKPLQCGYFDNFYQIRFGVYTHTLHACCFVGLLEAVVEFVAVAVTLLDMLGTVCTEGTDAGLLPTVQTQGLKQCVKGRTVPMPTGLLPTPTVNDATNIGGVSYPIGLSGQISGICRRV